MNKSNTALLESALKCPTCIVSVMGDHAGEGSDTIFDRKINDIDRTGLTFWLMRSAKARPSEVQNICKTFPIFTIFVEPSTKGGARPTTEEDAAIEYSPEKVFWHKLSKKLSPVTGKLDASATALVFDKMTTDVNGTLDLWDYGEAFDIQKPIRFMLGCSTICAVLNNTKLHPDKMKSRYRGIVAIARLANPYCVWLR
jgi:hypothetical protein